MWKINQLIALSLGISYKQTNNLSKQFYFKIFYFLMQESIDFTTVCFFD